MTQGTLHEKELQRNEEFMDKYTSFIFEVLDKLPKIGLHYVPHDVYKQLKGLLHNKEVDKKNEVERFKFQCAVEYVCACIKERTIDVPLVQDIIRTYYYEQENNK